MALSALAVEKAKPKEKIYQLKDDDGLYLEVKPTGKKFWRFRYWLQYKENRMSLGEYPLISLAEARLARDDQRRLIANGIDPVEKSKSEKATASGANSFEAVAREWAGKHVHTWTEGHAALTLRRLELNVFPYLGKRPISDISAPDLLECLRLIESRGALEVIRAFGLVAVSRPAQTEYPTGPAQAQTMLKVHVGDQLTLVGRPHNFFAITSFKA